MKILKRLLILSLCFSLIVPSMPAYATGLPVPPVENQDSQPTDTPTDDSGSGGSMSEGDFGTSDGSFYVDSSSYESLTGEDLSPEEEEAFDNNTLPPEEKEQLEKDATDAAKAQSRTYGVNVYLAEMPNVGMGDKALIAQTAEGMLMSAGGNPVFVKSIKLGGAVDDSSSFADVGLFRQIAALDGKDTAAFFECLSALGVDESIKVKYQEQLKQYADGKPANLPVILCWPGVSDGGDMVDLFELGQQGLSVCAPAAQSANALAIAAVFNESTGSEVGYSVLEGAGGGVIAGTNMIGSLSSYTGLYLFGAWATPIDAGDPPPPPLLQSSFFVTADPKKAGNDWEKVSTVTGVYRLYPNITEVDISNANGGYLDIVINADFNAGSIPNAILKANSVTATLSNKQAWDNLLKSDSNSVIEVTPTTSTFHIPVSHVGRFNETAIVYTASISGGTASGAEEARPAMFNGTVNGTAMLPQSGYSSIGFTASGVNGFNYTSWIAPPPSYLPDTAYDKHTVDIPQGESLVVANSADSSKQQWDASVAIPSTENVSIKTGAEAGMADAYGWICGRPLTGVITPGNRTLGITEDDKGSKIGDQAATRTITLKGMVTDCWGSDNPVCKLSDASKVIKSNSITASDGSVYDQDPKTCGGHSCGSGSVGGGTYNNPKHKATKYECGNHYNGKPGWDTYDEQHPGNCGGSNENIQYDAFGNETSRSCACTSCSSGSVSPNSHDCSFNVTVHDSIGEDYIGQKGMPKTGTATGVNASHEYGLITISNQPQSGIDIYWKISWKPSVDEQYYIVTYDVWNVDRASGASGCHSDARGSSGNKAWGPSGTHYTGTWPTSDTVLCNDYTHGTGYSKKCYENMVHKGTHHYTIKYTETVDAYVYRTIENASVYSLTHISLDKVHQISRNEGTDIDGSKYEKGTFNAPMDVGGGTRAVSAPDAVGYMWRCLGKNHGEYKSGNGRILWEAWVDSLAKSPAAGNVTIERPDNYFLGDVTVTIKAVQDSEWATTIKDEDTWDTMSDAGVTNNGELMDHIHDHNRTSTLKYETTASDTKYLNGPVGDQTRSGSGSGKTATENDDSQHQGVVLKEIKHIMNYWSGTNSGLRSDSGGKQLFYKANILSDTLVYGGTTDTNIFLEDAYAVDGTGEDRGIALFNIHAKPSNVSCGPSVNNNTGNIEAYRQHQNDAATNGSTILAMKDTIRADSLSKATVLDVGHMALFGGVNSSGTGGTVPLASSLAGQMPAMSIFGLNCNASKGDPVAYSGVLEPSDSHVNKDGVSGLTTIKAITESSLSSNTFGSAYWGPITYETMGGGSTKVNVNNKLSNIGGFSTTDNGTACLSAYGTMAISNIPLVHWTPNSSWFTGQMGSHYIQSAIALGEVPKSNDAPEPRVEIQDTHNKISGDGSVIAPCGANGTAYLNAIRIYNPMSAENDYVIGSQVGRFEESPNVTDDTDHDQRINELTGGYIRDESDYPIKTKPYVVQSQYLWTWLSPFGNFSSIGGSSNSNTASMSLSGKGEHSHGYYGYVDNMQVGQWISNAGIAYPFIAGLPSGIEYTTKPFVEIPVSKMLIAHSATGNGGGKLSGSAKNNILNEYSDPDKFYWGNAFAVTNTSNVLESDMDNINSPITKVRMVNYGINPYLFKSDSELQGEAIFGYKYSEESNISDTTANAVYKNDPVNLVGSIGNVTIHDVEDFRFSNYFKKATDDWLIDGVIKEVDINKPIRVVSSIKDICFNDVTHYIEGGEIRKIETKAKPLESEPTPNTRGHATLGVTIFNRDWSYGGMAGYYDPLPLVPQYNVIDEYRTEAVRLGYKSFISVDTIGQYQSYLYKDEVRPDGPGDTDTRSKYLAVESEYYLYDMEDGKFYDVDLWSGSTGGKERIYNGTNKKTEQTTHAGAIYQEVRLDGERRNIGFFERIVSRAFADATDNTPSSRYQDLTYYYSTSHYIGRPGSLRLDNRDLSYIGSESNFSEDRFWSESSVDSTGLNKNAQRYHFKDGLTSTTVITEPLGSNPTQAQIMDANQKVREEHPYSVLVQFMNFTAVGDIWTIKHNGSAVMQDTFTIFDTNGDDPDDPDDDNKYLPKDWQASVIRPHNTVKYHGIATYNPITGVQSGTIDKDSTPIVVYQAYHTSADDRTISGTH